MTERKKPGVAFWVTVVVVALALTYPLGLKPAMLLVDRMPSLSRQFAQVYWPIGWIAVQGPRPIRRAIWAYVMVGVPEGTIVSLPISSGGGAALSICQKPD